MRNKISANISPRGWRAFVAAIAEGGHVLDVGCGNNSPYRVKSQRPDLHYTGLDVGDYNQTTPILADRYIVTSGEDFAATIESLAGTQDAVISSHNLEHCLDPDRTLRAMVAALKPGGKLSLHSQARSA